jgi:hypothetical protein
MRRHVLRTWLIIGGLLAVAAGLAGCASPEYRIRKNPELFASFPPEVQTRVRAGQIDIGYTKDMVRIALGRPDRVYVRQTAAAAIEIWAYVAVSTAYEGGWGHAPVGYLAADGGYHPVLLSAFGSTRVEREHDVLRVEFTDGKVSAIERGQP